MQVKVIGLRFFWQRSKYLSNKCKQCFFFFFPERWQGSVQLENDAFGARRCIYGSGMMSAGLGSCSHCNDRTVQQCDSLMFM